MSPYVDIVIVTSPADLGRAVRRRRRQQGWSQGELAEEAKVSRQWVGALEAGKVTVELDAVLRTVAALGLAVDLVDAPPEHGDIDLDTLLP